MLSKCMDLTVNCMSLANCLPYMDTVRKVIGKFLPRCWLEQCFCTYQGLSMLSFSTFIFSLNVNHRALSQKNGAAARWLFHPSLTNQLFPGDLDWRLTNRWSSAGNERRSSPAAGGWLVLWLGFILLHGWRLMDIYFQASYEAREMLIIFCGTALKCWVHGDK